MRSSSGILFFLFSLFFSFFVTKSRLNEDRCCGSYRRYIFQPHLWNLLEAQVRFSLWLNWCLPFYKINYELPSTVPVSAIQPHLSTTNGAQVIHNRFIGIRNRAFCGFVLEIVKLMNDGSRETFTKNRPISAELHGWSVRIRRVHMCGKGEYCRLCISNSKFRAQQPRYRRCPFFYFAFHRSNGHSVRTLMWAHEASHTGYINTGFRSDHWGWESGQGREPCHFSMFVRVLIHPQWLRRVSGGGRS